MPLHPDPTSIAEELARHLEMNYGLQLDPWRHKHLVAEMAEYGHRFVARSCFVVCPDGIEKALTDTVEDIPGAK